MIYMICKEIIMSDYFKNINEIKFEGGKSENPLSFRFYDENKIVLGKPMKEHLRFAYHVYHNIRIKKLSRKNL